MNYEREYQHKQEESKHLKSENEKRVNRENIKAGDKVAVFTVQETTKGAAWTLDALDSS